MEYVENGDMFFLFCYEIVVVAINNEDGHLDVEIGIVEIRLKV